MPLTWGATDLASIPLVALQTRDEQQSPLAMYAQAQQIKNAQTQQQTAQLQQQGLQQENQQRALQLQDQQTLRSLAPNHVIKDADGNVTGFDTPGLLKEAAGKGVNPQTLNQMQNQYAESVKNLAGANEAVRNNETAKNKALYETLESLRNIQDPAQRSAALQQAIPSLQKQGVDTSKLTPNEPLDDKSLDVVEAGLGMHSQMINDAKGLAEANKASADAALTNIKVNLSKNSKPGDFDKQIDTVAPPTGTTAALNARTKAMVNASLQRGDFEGAQKAIDAASSEIGAIEKETNPDVRRAKISEAVGTEIGKQQALAVPLQQLTNTTMAGRKYINREDLPKEAAGVMEQQAASQGIRVVDKDTAGTLSDIDDAKANMNTMMNLVNGKLATSPAERIYKGPENKLEAAAQTDPTLASMGTFRNAAIKTMRAVAGSKGLRINQYEVQLAIDNDIPKMTDTWEVAAQKIKTLNKFLDNAENAHLSLNRQATSTPSATSGPPKTADDFMSKHNLKPGVTPP